MGMFDGVVQHLDIFDGADGRGTDFDGVGAVAKYGVVFDEHILEPKH